MYFWQQWKTNVDHFESIKVWWDVGKVTIQQFCKPYTLNTSRNIVKLIEDVGSDIIELQLLKD